MAQLQTKVPPRPGSAAGEILELARGLDRPAVDVSAVRKRLEAKVREEHQRLDDYSASVNVVVADIIGLMRAGQTVKVDELIQSFRRDELETVRSKQEFESDAAKVLRAVAKRVPEGLRLANDALAEALRISDRIAALYNDARWRLMEARAHFHASPGKGPVHGQATDIDEYLKTLS